MSDDVFRWVIAIGVGLVCAASIWHAITLAGLIKVVNEAQKAGKEGLTKIAPALQDIEQALAAWRTIMSDNRSRVAEITTETLAIAKATRQQVENIGELLDDTGARVRARIAQIDRTVDRTVEQVEHASEAARSAVQKPVKEVTAVMAGVKAAVATYAQGGRRSVERATQDEEMFI